MGTSKRSRAFPASFFVFIAAVIHAASVGEWPPRPGLARGVSSPALSPDRFIPRLTATQFYADINGKNIQRTFLHRRTTTVDYVPAVLGAKYGLRIEDLRPDHVLIVTCFACKHEGVIYGSWLKRRYAPHCRLRDIENRFRCQRCNNAALNAWQVCCVYQR